MRSLHDRVPPQPPLPPPAMHTIHQPQDAAQLTPNLCLVQAIAPDCSALPSLLYLMNALASLEAQFKSHLLPEIFHNPQAELILLPLIFLQHLAQPLSWHL